MENKQVSLEDYARFCECAEKSAKINILLDFIKQANTHFYSLKGKGEELNAQGKNLISDKLRELNEMMNELR